MNNKWKAAIAGTVVGALALAGCGGGSSASDSKDTVNLVGFSILEQANKQVIADFNKTGDGSGVDFQQSYGASGDQARAVIGGQDADVVHLSLEPDVQKLVDEKLVADDWKSTPSKGILTQSVVVIVVRKGNPKNIQGWDDLVKPGRQDHHPEPRLVRLGEVEHPRGLRARARRRWQRGRRVGLPHQVLQQRRGPPGQRPGRHHGVPERPGRRAAVLRERGDPGPAERRGLRLRGPAETLLIQNPGAVTTDANPTAKKFLEYLTGKEAQTDYAEEGFRPLDDSIKVEVQGANDPADPFPAPSKKLLTIDGDFGGWSEANTKFFDENDGLVTKIQKETGKES